ncbi:hypothetical protein sos41_25520 [Alphaproteobacteria bacterium SO-S41]|nr:hypothetical protein sos41_25520 [Alphaproteobacteria bacterium SO-S41]
MAEVKTKPTTASPVAYLDTIEDEGRRKDAKALLKIYKDVTGEKPVMWGTAIVGFGSYKLKSGDWPLTAFAVRKSDLTLYVGAKRQAERLKSLGKHKVGGGCLYVKRLSDIDEGVLREVIADSYKHTKENNPAC